MPMIDALLAELEQEAATTRRVLERVPEDKLGWKPHAKSMSLGQLALHIATTPGNVAKMSTQDTMERPQFVQAEAGSVAEIVSAFDQSVATAKQVLAGTDDARLMASWRLTHGDQVLMEVPRVGILRAIMLNHWYHHRGQLTVYLRLLDVALPSVYGPTADESPFG